MKLFVLSFVDRQEGLVVNILHAIHLRQSAIEANIRRHISLHITPRRILLIVIKFEDFCTEASARRQNSGRCTTSKIYSTITEAVLAKWSQ